MTYSWFSLVLLLPSNRQTINRKGRRIWWTAGQSDSASRSKKRQEKLMAVGIWRLSLPNSSFIYLSNSKIINGNRGWCRKLSLWKRDLEIVTSLICFLSNDQLFMGDMSFNFFLLLLNDIVTSPFVSCLDLYNRNFFQEKLKISELRLIFSHSRSDRQTIR